MGISFYWREPGGAEIQLGQTSATKVKAFSGLGMAPLEHFLQGLPTQHRQLHRGMKFRPRVVQLALWDRRASASAQESRQVALLAALNPDKGEGTLKIVLNDGTIRYLDCYVQEGPDFASSDRPRWGGSQFYTVRFVALDPFLYDPDQKSVSGNFNGSVEVELTATNSGDMGTYPTITIAGEVQSPRIELDTGEYLYFPSYTVPAGGQVTIDCQEGTVTLADGTNGISELASGSTFFYIPRGSHTLTLTCTSGTSQVTVAWYDRYLGI